MKRKTEPPLPSRFAEPGASPGFLLWKIANAWQRRQRAALQPLGLTHSQFVVLAAASWFSASETLTQARLAELTGIDAMTTSTLVRALEAEGLLERRDHPGDVRAKAIEATRSGREKARKAIAIVEETDAAFFAPLADGAPRLVRTFQSLLDADVESEAGGE
jgi:DNA-binding MarR family transcriptional regulator